jgi:hypothetical protein
MKRQREKTPAGSDIQRGLRSSETHLTRNRWKRNV